jgi:putative toxin-antitoxin system antitoxin component (TIGR02293 family)
MIEAGYVENSVARAYDLLGGLETIKAPIRNSLDAHDVLMRGLPSGTLMHLVRAVTILGDEKALIAAIGISPRTLQRRKSEKQPKLLSVDQSNRTWRFAEILGHAIDVLGTKDEAEAWMNRPATGLSNRRPLDLLGTTAGVEAVEEYLTRLEYGVHA